MFRRLFVFACGSFLASCTISNVSANEDPVAEMKRLQELLQPLMIDIILADGLSVEEKQMAIPDIESIVDLTEEERVVLAKKVAMEMESFNKSNNSSEMSTTQGFLGLLGQLYSLANMDANISEDELHRLETYRLAWAPNHTLEDANAEAAKQAQKMRYQAMESEVPITLKGIQFAQKQYEEQFDVYVPAEPYPPRRSGEEQTHTWVSSESGGFKELGYEPSFGDVRGTYWVEVSNVDFTAYGVIDVDGDGVFQTYYATSSIAPTILPTKK